MHVELKMSGISKGVRLTGKVVRELGLNADLIELVRKTELADNYTSFMGMEMIITNYGHNFS